MTSNYLPRIDSDVLKNELRNVPILSERLLIDMVNSINVVDNNIVFRENNGHLSRMLASVFGTEMHRQNLIDRNISEALTTLTNWMQEIVQLNTVSNLALEHVSTQLDKTIISVNEIANFSLANRTKIKTLHEEINIKIAQINEELQSLKLAQKSKQRIDEVVEFWKLGQLYNNYPLVLQALFALHHLSSGDEGRYIYTTDSTLLKYAVAKVANTFRDKMANGNRFGDYYSLQDWLFPLSIDDKHRLVTLFIIYPYQTSTLHNALQYFLLEGSPPTWIVDEQNDGNLVVALSGKFLLEMFSNEIQLIHSKGNNDADT